MLEQILLIIQVVVCVFLVLLVLVQQGKGATMGAAFGSGASTTVFGSKGSGSFLMKFTGLVAFVFFANSLALCYVSAEQAKMARQESIIQMPIPNPILESTRPAMPMVPAKQQTSVSELKSSVPEKSVTYGQSDKSK